jgi:hypothetical protein
VPPPARASGSSAVPASERRTDRRPRGPCSSSTTSRTRSAWVPAATRCRALDRRSRRPATTGVGRRLDMDHRLATDRRPGTDRHRGTDRRPATGRRRDTDRRPGCRERSASRWRWRSRGDFVGLRLQHEVDGGAQAASLEAEASPSDRRTARSGGSARRVVPARGAPRGYSRQDQQTGVGQRLIPVSPQPAAAAAVSAALVTDRTGTRRTAHRVEPETMCELLKPFFSRARGTHRRAVALTSATDGG